MVLFILTVLMGIQTASAAVNTTSLGNTSQSFVSEVQTNHTIPSEVYVDGYELNPNQYLYLTAKNIEKQHDVMIRYMNPAPNPYENLCDGEISQEEYLDIAERVRIFMDTYGRAPNYATTSLGKMRTENLMYMFAKIELFNNVYGRLPSTIVVKKWVEPEAPKITETTSIQAKIDAIGYQEAKYLDIQGQSSASVMESVGYGDCWADSYWLYNKLSAINVAVRIVQCSGGSYPLHRWVQINIGSGWTTWNYAKYNSKHVGAITTSYYIVKSST